MTPFGKWNPIETRKPHPQWERVKGAGGVKVKFKGANEINALVNYLVAYTPEILDHWQCPRDTMNTGHGDCEDFAILKRALIGRGDLIIGYDNILRQNHAVLLVDGKVLDCTHDKLLTPEEMPHFTPRIGMNGTTQWVYGERI